MPGHYGKKNGGKGGSPGTPTPDWDKDWPPKPKPQPKPKLARSKYGPNDVNA